MRVFFRSEKVKRNIRLIAHHPTIVPRTDVKDVSGLHDVRSSVLHRACSLSRDHHTDVLHLTREVPATGATCCDHLQPGSYVARPIVIPPILISSNRPFSKVRTSSGFSNRLIKKSMQSGSIGLTWLALIKRLPSIDVFYYVCSRNLDHSNPAML